MSQYPNLGKDVQTNLEDLFSMGFTDFDMNIS